MSEEKKKLGKVEFRFEKTPDYKIIMASGIWGGINPEGLIFFDLFLDYPTSPISSEREIGEKELGPEIVHSSSDPIAIKRLQQIGVLITPRTAIAISRWLTEKAELALKGQEDAT
jgi:hypothetical protein